MYGVTLDMTKRQISKGSGQEGQGRPIGDRGKATKVNKVSVYKSRTPNCKYTHNDNFNIYLLVLALHPGPNYPFFSSSDTIIGTRTVLEWLSVRPVS